jgi:formylmethanofuran dehydrogenase subunit C
MLAEMSRPVAATAVSKRFGRFKDEEEKAVRAPAVVRDEMLERFIDVWKRNGDEGDLWAFHAGIERYVGSQSGYTSADVEKFSIALAEFQDDSDFSTKAGIFLSELINNGNDSDYVIHTRHLVEKIEFLGYANTKNIVVRGDVGRSAAYLMKEGRLVVEGNAGDLLGGDLEGGEILVTGNAGDSAGKNMHGGRLAIKGNAGLHVGRGMLGGEILIEGNVFHYPFSGAGGNLGDYLCGGKITVMGNAGEIGPTLGGEIHLHGTFTGIYRFTHARGKPNSRNAVIYHQGKRIFPREDWWARLKRNIKSLFESGGGDKSAS